MTTRPKTKTARKPEARKDWRLSVVARFRKDVTRLEARQIMDATVVEGDGSFKEKGYGSLIKSARVTNADIP